MPYVLVRLQEALVGVTGKWFVSWNIQHRAHDLVFVEKPISRHTESKKYYVNMTAHPVVVIKSREMVEALSPLENKKIWIRHCVSCKQPKGCILWLRYA